MFGCAWPDWEAAFCGNEVVQGYRERSSRSLRSLRAAQGVVHSTLKSASILNIDRGWSVEPALPSAGARGNCGNCETNVRRRRSNFRHIDIAVRTLHLTDLSRFQCLPENGQTCACNYTSSTICSNLLSHLALAYFLSTRVNNVEHIYTRLVAEWNSLAIFATWKTKRTCIEKRS